MQVMMRAVRKCHPSESLYIKAKEMQEGPPIGAVPEEVGMDFVGTTKDLTRISNNQRTLCHRYADERNKFGEARYDLALLLVPHQDEPRYQKAAFDKQLLFLLSETLETNKVAVYKMYEDYIKCRERYKGLALMIQRNSERISWQQSLLKFAREND